MPRWIVIIAFTISLHHKAAALTAKCHVALHKYPLHHRFVYSYQPRELDVLFRKWYSPLPDIRENLCFRV